MPSAAGSVGHDPGTPWRRRTPVAPRAARSLVAALAVGCMAVTTAAAQPTASSDDAAPSSAVYAFGGGGLGALELPRVTAGGGDGQRPDGSGSAAERAPAGQVAPDRAVDEPGGPVDIIPPGEENLAAFVPAGLGDHGIPAPTLRAYRAAAEVLSREEPGCRVDWALLAGIGRVESDHGRFGGAAVGLDGRSVPAILGPVLDGSLAGTMVILDSDAGVLDGDVAFDRAVGPMQFLPGTWARWGSDGDRDGSSDPQDIDDASLAAARYLCGGAMGLDQPGPAAVAVRRYNNSSAYVQLVLATAQAYRTGGGLFTPQLSDLDLPSGEPSPRGWEAPSGTVLAAAPSPTVPVEPSALTTAVPTTAVPTTTAPATPVPTTAAATTTTGTPTGTTTTGTPTGTTTTGTPTGTTTTGTPTGTTTGTPTTTATTTTGTSTATTTGTTSTGTTTPTAGTPTTPTPTPTTATTTTTATTATATTVTAATTATAAPTTAATSEGTSTQPAPSPCEPVGSAAEGEATEPAVEPSAAATGTSAPCLAADQTATPDPSP